MDEFGGLHNVKENIEQKENVVILENKPIPEVVTIKENDTQQEINDPFKRKPKAKVNESKKNHSLSLMSGSLAAIVGAATVGITQMINVGMSAEFVDVSYLDGVISYKINVKELTEKEELHLYYYAHDELQETRNIVDNGEITGSFVVDTEDLNTRIADTNTEVRYRLALSGNVGLNVERDFDNWVVKIEHCLSKFENVEGECHCLEDGCYHFKMNFTDDRRIFSDFVAYIVSCNGYTSNCEFTDDLHGWQTIDVTSNPDFGKSGTLHIEYNAEIDGAKVAQDPIIQEVHF